MKLNTETPEIGDYVLATKYDDGDPCDHFCVGFVSSCHALRNIDRPPSLRYFIVDNRGVNQRHNGFERAEKITTEEGRRLVELMPEIGDRRGPSVWWHLGKIRGEDNPECPNGYFDDEAQP